MTKTFGELSWGEPFRFTIAGLHNDWIKKDAASARHALDEAFVISMPEAALVEAEEPWLDMSREEMVEFLVEVAAESNSDLSKQDLYDELDARWRGYAECTDDELKADIRDQFQDECAIGYVMRDGTIATWEEVDRRATEAGTLPVAQRETAGRLLDPALVRDWIEQTRGWLIEHRASPGT